MNLKKFVVLALACLLLLTACAQTKPTEGTQGTQGTQGNDKVTYQEIDLKVTLELPADADNIG